MIPFYLNLKSLHMTNTLWGLIIPFMINTQNLIILRSGFEAVPESLIESARIDGASHYTVLFKIVLPLSKAIIAVVTLYYSVSIWNSWFWASAILRDRSMYPLQLILREILLENSLNGMAANAGTDSESVAMTIKYATVIVATLPILCVYPFLQRYFTNGIMIGAVKG
jgi:putative aldouronate transport system permease protein